VLLRECKTYAWKEENMLQKKTLAAGKVEVTFRMPPMDDVVELYLCGDFNAWQVRGLPLNLESDGTWVGKLVLEAGKSYRFRYHDNQGCWHTDYEADRYVTNEFESDDSVVDLTMAAEKSSNADATKKAGKPKGSSSGSKSTTKGRHSKAKR
jgi:1,4-alpha-glucan branching enzyme